MASFESEVTRIIDKFNGETLNLRKFIIKMLFAFMDLWDIVDGSEDPLPSDADPKLVKSTKYMSNGYVHHRLQELPRTCGGVEDCNFPKTKSLYNNPFIRRKYFNCKMQARDNLLDHVNKIKTFANQLGCLEVLVSTKTLSSPWSRICRHCMNI